MGSMIPTSTRRARESNESGAAPGQGPAPHYGSSRPRGRRSATGLQALHRRRHAGAEGLVGVAEHGGHELGGRAHLGHGGFHVGLGQVGLDLDQVLDAAHAGQGLDGGGLALRGGLREGDGLGAERFGALAIAS